MARSLRWKEKVALNVLLPSAIFILTLINVSDVLAQRPIGITYTCSATRLEFVIEHLSKKTGYDFIYSRNLIDISRPVSLTVRNKSIIEVLSLIERQVNVSFKLQDRHIIVKNNPHGVIAVSNPAERRTAKIETPSFKSTDSLLTSSLGRNISVVPRENHTEILRDHFDKRINELQALLGPGVPKNIPPFYINQINFNNRHMGWFGAIGTYVGDHGSGLELQAGLPYAYVVFHPKWSFTDGFNGAYGVGSSFNLAGNFSFNGIYMYSGKTTTETAHLMSPPNMPMGPEFRRYEVVRLHQIKMAVQYAFSKTLSIRVGPVLNYRNTARQFSVTTNSYSEMNYSYRQAVAGDKYTIAYQTGNQVVSASPILRFSESWIGWDASLIYRINFFRSR
jgi:hypothetical protein